MSIHSNFGTIRTPSEEMQFEWKISNFSSIVANDAFGFGESPIFIFATTPWFLELRRKSDINPDCMALRLQTRTFRPYPVEYNLGLKRVDNSVQQLDTGIMLAAKMYTDVCFIKRSELLLRKCELVPFDQITIVCSLKRGTIPFINPLPKKLINPNLQLDKIKDFLRDGEFCDVTLTVQNKKFKAHKMILAATSPVFESYLKHDTLENRTGVINIPDCDPESFKVFLEYLYCGKLENSSFCSFLDLYKTAVKYDIKELQMVCIKRIEHNLDMKIFCDIVAYAGERHDKNLFVIAQDFFNANLKAILLSAEWKNLLESNYNLANKFLIEMSSCIQGFVKRPRLEKIDPLSE